MTESEPVSQPRDRRVQAALEAYLERMDRGEAVDRDAFLAKHAEIADELRSFLETDEDLARLAGESSTSSAARRDAATLVPQRVQGKSSATDSGQLPAQFGRYRVLKPLGSGAMGTVFLAEDTQLQRKVALKTPSFDEDDSGELLERFYREARAAAVLRHSNICPVFDVDQIDGRHFISMAWIEGRTLSAYIQPDNPQPERQILLIIRKLALALREAHEQGIVHRDLKPGNIIIDPRGEPIIMDFGLARRVTTDEDNRITQSGVLVGSPAYMSPEQVEGEPDRIGPASDQYSLGVILYEMLTGQLPFRGSITGVIGQILTKKPTPPGKLRADLDPRIESLCRRMMAKQANERFPSVKDVADEVARILKTPRSDAARSAATGGSANAQSTPDAPSLRVAVTDSNVASLYEAARKCMRKRDYEQVVQILETLPEHKRNEDVVKLLAKARQLSDEVQFLLAEIDEALRLNDVEAALKKSDELLKLRPGHHRAKQVKEECSRFGSGLLFWRKRRTVDGRRVGEGSWIPWAAIAVFLVAFGATSWLVYDYLNSDGTVLDPDPIAGNGGLDNGSVDQDGPAPALAVAPFGEAEAARHQQEWADYLSVSIERDVVLPGGATMTFVLIPPGEFAVGESEGDATRIDQPFYLGAYEVTQEQYEQLMDDNPSERQALEGPVHNVSSDDAVAFCERLSELPENVAAGNMFRMPTEAEWEYACRAGSTADYSFGDDASQLGEYAWFGENSDRTMHPVGQKAENAWGLYDMHANVWEWCRDNLNGDRPIRGGCWYSKADLCRAGYRREIPASNDSILVGFRVVLEIDASAAGGDDWTDLFNGRDLTGWTPVQSAGGWRVTNGVLHCDDQGNGWLATQREFGDFELELDLKLPAQGNSGVFLRVPRDAAPNGAGLLEVQLLDDTAARFDGIQANQHTGALYGIVAPDPQVSVEPDVWHSLRIQAVALRIIVDVDGQQVIDADLEDYPQLAQQKPNALRTSGFIGLQRHQSAAEFRNIRIQESRSAIERDALLLQGTWRAVGQEIAGNTWTPEQIEEHEKTIKFTGNTFEIRNLDRTGRFQIERGTYELDPTRDPPHITMNGTNREGRAIEFLGICQIEGDQLRHCFVKTSDDPDAPRPTSFPTSSGTGQFSTTYRRDRGGESGVQRIPFPESASFTDARSLSELNEPGIINAYPWISTDGLTLYWTREGDGTSSIRQASRASLDAPFGSATTVLADARLASVSPDGLEIVCLFDADGDGNSAELCSGRRSVAGVVFGRPTVIESLRSLNRPKGTAFGSDGLSLLILESGDPDTGLRNRILISRRPDTGADWEAAEPVTIQGSIDRDSLTWPSFDALGDHLLFSFSEEGSRYLEWGGVADRTDGSLMFNNARPLLLEGDRFVTRGGRYCAASGELFFTHPVGTPPYQEMQLWVAHAQN